MRRHARPLVSLSSCLLVLAAPALAQTPAPAPTARQQYKPLNIPAQLPIATGYTVQDAFPTANPPLTFVQPLSIVAPPGEKDRLFIVSKTGTIELLTDLKNPNGPTRSTFLDLRPYLREKDWGLGQPVEWGLLGLAFHPDFAHNGYFYITYNPTLQEDGRQHGFDRLSRFSVSKSDPNKADMTSELPLFTQLDLAPNHNGGCIQFGPDGYLYTSIGDEGDANDSFDNARWIDKDFFAAIFRIDVDRKPANLEPNPHSQKSTAFPSAVIMTGDHANYKIPADNPLVGITSYLGRTVDPTHVRTEIYANGLRNSWRFSFDPPTGRLFDADVGQDKWEEVDIITKGGNYGWSYREALIDGPRVSTTPPGAKFLDPIYEYPHTRVKNDQFSGNSISGGFIYRGSNLPELFGQYIFGDYAQRRIWALKENPDGKWTPSLLAENVGEPVEFVPDPATGDVLFPDIGPLRAAPGGHIKRLVKTGVQGAPPPALLSQTGAFKDLKTLTVADGLVPYQPNVPFWSDYAIKGRWFLIANPASKITFNSTGNWTFPTGMVWVKQFEIETKRGDPSTLRRLETRFLVKTADHVYGITYKWRPDNSDADLVPATGEDETFTVTVDGKPHQQTWHYPSQAECLTCHTDVASGALGFNTLQLNGNGSGTANQLVALANAGYFANPSDLPTPASLPAYAKADDKSASLEWRVRSYLGANCVQCHQPGGISQGQWDARATTPDGLKNLINAALVATRGDPAARILVPNDSAHSMLLTRIEGAQGAPRMPPLATNERDIPDEQLIQDYIKSLGPAPKKAAR